MPKGRGGERHPRYQLPLELELDRIRRAEAAAYRAAVLELSSGAREPSGRFVERLAEPVSIRTPSDGATYLMAQVYIPFERFDQEEFWVLLLNTRKQITHKAMVYRGTLNIMYVRTGELFKEAIRLNADSILLSHCHPSGEPTPSPEDIQATTLAVEAGKLLDIPLLDHIVVGRDRWVSMKERGLGFTP